MPLHPVDLRGAARWRWLRSAIARLKKHPRKHLAHIVAIGRLLAQIKRVIGHSEWTPWLVENWPYAPRAAREAMRAANELADVENGVLRRFGPSAIRVLCNGTIPKSHRRKVLESATGSKLIGGVGAFLRIAEEDGWKTEPKPARSVAESEAARTHRQLLSLIETCGMLHMSVDRDPDSPSVTITLFPDDGPQRRVSRGDLSQALAAAADQELSRQCPRCLKHFPPSNFAKSTSACRKCERARVKAATLDKRNR